MKSVSDRILEALSKRLDKVEEIRSYVKAKQSNPSTREELLKAYRHHIVCTGGVAEALMPNNKFSKEDIAFGYLDNNEIVVAIDFKDVLTVDIGYVSHSLLLVLMGYSPHPDEPNPKHDYKIRGIIKKNMGNAIVFWENAETLLASANYTYLIRCLKELRSKGLIGDENEVYGSGRDGFIGLIQDII